MISDSAEGFQIFMGSMQDRESPPHVVDWWMPEIYDARENDEGVILEAHRYSLKTTVVSLFVAMQIGLNPQRSNLILSAGKEPAAKITSSIKGVLEHSVVFKGLCPNVVPDTDRGWSAEGGFWVKRMDMSYRKWRKLSQDKTPTFDSQGTESRFLGARYDGLIVIDDVVDRNIADSPTRLSNVSDVLFSTVKPMVTQNTQEIVLATPWTVNDPLHLYKKMPGYRHIFMPLYVPASDGDEGAVYDEEMGEWIRIYFEQEWPLSRVQLERARDKVATNGIRWASNMLLDLTARDRQVFKPQLVERDQISWNWRACGGIDPAFSRGSEADNFAMGVGLIRPEGGVVIVDGFLSKEGQTEAELKIMGLQRQYSRTGQWLGSAIETDGAGAPLSVAMQERTQYEMLLNPMRTGGRSKPSRLKGQLAPWVNLGQVQILNQPNHPYLKALLQDMAMFPNGSLDALDSTYYLARQAQYHGALWMPPSDGTGLAGPGESRLTPYQRRAKASAGLWFKGWTS